MVSTVLVVGGTGNVGRLVLQQLLERGHTVKAVVRNESKLPDQISSHPNFHVIKGTLLDFSQADLEGFVTGCDAVISTLGHVLNFSGVFGPPRDLVTQAAKRLCKAIQSTKPATPAKYILLNTVGVSNASGSDRKRGTFEAGFLWVLGALLPPLTDSYRSAWYLAKELGQSSEHVEWTVVRPDAFRDGDVTPYSLHEQLQSSLFNPGHTRMANIAHFMSDLVDKPSVWEEWKWKMPVILDSE